VAYVDTDPTAPTAALGPLFVSGTNANAPQRISDGPVLAFFWSPDGRYLLYLTLEMVSAPSDTTKTSFSRQQDQSLWMHWYVWDGQKSVAYARFVPTATLLVDYLRYFDQFAQSMTLWAPDSGFFTYAGSDESGVDGIWVQSLAAGTAPVRVAAGQMATWSPH
jgi:TolB protein